jgi:hypothetical protein
MSPSGGRSAANWWPGWPSWGWAWRGWRSLWPPISAIRSAAIAHPWRQPDRYSQEDTLDIEIGGFNLKPPSDGAYLNETDLPKIAHVLAHNIVGFAPYAARRQTLGGAKNVTLLGTYFARHVVFGTQDLSPGFAPRIPGGRFRCLAEDNSEDVLLGEHLATQLNRTAEQEMKLAAPPSHRWYSFHRRAGRQSDRRAFSCAAAPGKLGAVRRIYVSGYQT